MGIACAEGLQPARIPGMQTGHYEAMELRQMTPCRWLLALFLALTVLPFSGSAQTGHEPLEQGDQATIRSVIESQIDAFRADDGDKAFSFASPGIRRMFGTSDTFMEMVRSGYAPVYRPRNYGFGRLITRGGLPVQVVRLVGPDGRRIDAHYHMERQPDGSWRIAGCQLVEPDDESA